MLYNFVAKFETTIYVGVLDKGFFENLPGFEMPQTKHTVATTVTVKNGSLLDENTKKEFCEMYKEKLQERFKDFQKSVRVEMPVFVGYEDIEEVKEIQKEQEEER